MVLDAEMAAILDSDRVLILDCTTKKEVLNRLIECLAGAKQVKDPQALAAGVFRREELMSTGIGLGIAVPHVRLDSVTGPVMAVGLCRNPVTDYESLDGEPVQIVFLIAAGKNQHAEYLRMLATISSRLKEKKLREDLIGARDAGTVYSILTDKD